MKLPQQTRLARIRKAEQLGWGLLLLTPFKRFQREMLLRMYLKQAGCSQPD